MTCSNILSLLFRMFLTSLRFFCLSAGLFLCWTFFLTEGNFCLTPLFAQQFADDSFGQILPEQNFYMQNFAGQSGQNVSAQNAYGLSGSSMSGQNVSNQYFPNQNFSGQNFSNQNFPGQVSSAQLSSEFFQPGQPFPNQVYSEPFLSGQSNFGQVYSGQILPGEIILDENGNVLSNPYAELPGNFAGGNDRLPFLQDGNSASYLDGNGNPLNFSDEKLMNMPYRNQAGRNNLSIGEQNQGNRLNRVNQPVDGQNFEGQFVNGSINNGQIINGQNLNGQFVNGQYYVNGQYLNGSLNAQNGFLDGNIPLSGAVGRMSGTNRQNSLPDIYTVLRETPSEMDLRAKIHLTLQSNRNRTFLQKENEPQEVLEFSRAWGADAVFFNPDSSSADSVYTLGVLCWNYPCGGKELFRLDLFKNLVCRVGAGTQKKRGDFLASLAFANVSLDYEIQIGDKKFQVFDLLELEKKECVIGADISSVAVGLAAYLNGKDEWTTAQGEKWSLKTMTNEILTQFPQKSGIDKIDQLLALTFLLIRFSTDYEALNSPSNTGQNAVHLTNNADSSSAQEEKIAISLFCEPILNLLDRQYLQAIQCQSRIGLWNQHFFVLFSRNQLSENNSDGSSLDLSGQNSLSEQNSIGQNPSGQADASSSSESASETVIDSVRSLQERRAAEREKKRLEEERLAALPVLSGEPYVPSGQNSSDLSMESSLDALRPSVSENSEKNSIEERIKNETTNRSASLWEMESRLSPADSLKLFSANAHFILWLSCYVPKDELESETMRRAVSALNEYTGRFFPTDVPLNQLSSVEVEALSTALHALSVYLKRCEIQ